MSENTETDIRNRSLTIHCLRQLCEIKRISTNERDHAIEVWASLVNVDVKKRVSMFYSLLTIKLNNNSERAIAIINLLKVVCYVMDKKERENTGFTSTTPSASNVVEYSQYAKNNIDAIDIMINRRNKIKRIPKHVFKDSINNIFFYLCKVNEITKEDRLMYLFLFAMALKTYSHNNILCINEFEGLIMTNMNGDDIIDKNEITIKFINKILDRLTNLLEDITNKETCKVVFFTCDGLLNLYILDV